MPRFGAKKLYFLLNNELKQLKIARDKFINTLRANHLLIALKHSYHITTNSHHHFRKPQNQILDLQIKRPAQVWVSGYHLYWKKRKPVLSEFSNLCVF